MKSSVSARDNIRQGGRGEYEFIIVHSLPLVTVRVQSAPKREREI